MITLSIPVPARCIPTSLKPLKPSRQNISLSKSLECPKFESLKNRLIRVVDAVHLPEAIATLDFMIQQGITPDLQTYSIILKSCIRSRNFELGKLVHAQLTHSKIEPDSVVVNSLISLYSKCGDWETANSIFEHIEDSARDLVSWSAMISCFAHNGMESKAISTFVNMLEIGHYPNQFCFSAVIQACSNPDSASIGIVIFGLLIKSGYFESDSCVGCALIDLFAKGYYDLNSAKRVFDKMPLRNTVTWNLMITRFTQLDYPNEAVDFFLRMLSSEYMPDRFTLSSIVSASAEMGFLPLGRQLHSLAIKHKLANDICVSCSLVDMYSKCASDRNMDDSRKVFDHMTNHNVMSWTAIASGYVENGDNNEAIKLFREMIITSQVRPNHFTFASVLKACRNISDPLIAEQVYAHAVKLGLSLVNCVGNSVISMFVQFGRMDDARKAFRILFEKNLICQRTIINRDSKNLISKDDYESSSQADDVEIGITPFTFSSLLSGAATIGSIGKGEQIHSQLIKFGLGSDQLISNSLISMYSKCGSIESSFQVFTKMSSRNIRSWTAVITALAKHGFAEKALKMFQEMLKTGTKPNEVTYIAILSACSHVGLISEGLKHFEMMQKEHKIVPRMEHYACVVDLFGRSGYLTEAFEFITSMPLVADSLVWRTLLGACRVHGNTELGEYAANMIVQRDPHDPTAYILLSNLYASTGQWETVGKIRKSMKERNLIKESGCSWIEIEKRVHKFFVGDTSHPRANEIYRELNNLNFRIKNMGYIPVTDFVLHDVEEEQKEQYLFQHSEKIAVAFALISTSKSKPIRVFKNLRVCGDCHTAIKYISMATGREIVLRDSNRFHHIKDGACSCNDYW